MTRAESLSLATLPPLARIVAGFALLLATWETRRRTRVGLQHLDGHLLRDIGLTQPQAQAETAKPFWRD